MLLSRLAFDFIGHLVVILRHGLKLLPYCRIATGIRQPPHLSGPLAIFLG